MLTRKVTKTLYKIGDFISWKRAKLLELSPFFQRRPLWPLGAKSFLLDTIVRGYPIPIIFLREQKTDLTRLEPKREVVDGQQRIRTLFSFIDPSLLEDYRPARDQFQIKRTHNPELANKDFRHLPKDIKQKILEYEFSVHVLPSSVDDREVLQIFARMNSTGYKLNDQELRNADFFGEFKTCMFTLAAAQLSRWRDWKIFTEDNIARMQEVELTSEFAQLMISGIVGKSQASLNALYKRKNVDFPERTEVERRFRTTMDAIEQLLGTTLPKTAYKKRVPFYALFAFFYDALYGIGSKLKRTSPAPLRKSYRASLLKASQQIQFARAPARVLESLARRTTHPESRRTVLAYLKKTCGLA